MRRKKIGAVVVTALLLSTIFPQNILAMEATSGVTSEIENTSEAIRAQSAGEEVKAGEAAGESAQEQINSLAEAGADEESDTQDEAAQTESAQTGTAQTNQQQTDGEQSSEEAQMQEEAGNEQTESTAEDVIRSGADTQLIDGTTAEAAAAETNEEVAEDMLELFAAKYTSLPEYDFLSLDIRSNCVYFARYMVPSLPMGLTTLADKKAIINSTKAVPGAIAISTMGNSYYGHVCYVEAVNGNQITTLHGGMGSYYGNHIVRVTGTATETKIIGYYVPEGGMVNAGTILPYKDVSSSSWYYDYVKFCFEEGLMTGTDDTHFSPDQILTRGMFVTILYRMEGSPDVTFTKKFGDVPDGQFYSSAVTWANKHNIVTGYEDSNNFGVSDPITREQLAVMLYRYADYNGQNTSIRNNLSSFPDRDSVSSYAKSQMQWAVAAELISGDQGKLNPQGASSRAVCATMINRFADKYL